MDDDRLQLTILAYRAVGDVLKLITRSPIDLTEVFKGVLSNALTLCDAQLGILFLYDPQKGYRAVYAEGISDEFQRWFDNIGDFIPAPGTGLGRLASQKGCVNIADVRSEDIYRVGDPLRIATADLGGARSFVAIPMLSGDTLKGAFTIYRQTVRPFDEAHVDIAEKFADQAVIALENARLLNEATGLSKALYEVNQRLEEKVRQQLAELEVFAKLKRFLPDRIAQVVSAGDTSILNSHRRNIACIFCDVRRFTRFSENAEPEEVIQVLDSFHRKTSDLASLYDATVVSRSGDGVMIVVNDPLPVAQPVIRALELVEKMRSQLAGMCENWNRHEYDLGFGIGVSYGYATLGVFGSENYQNYTAVGTVVNVASRLCDAAADGEVLVTQRVRAEAGDEYNFVPRGQLELKGLTRPLTVFEMNSRLDVQ